LMPCCYCCRWCWPQDQAYPGWAPNPSSEVVELARRAIAEVTGAVRSTAAAAACACMGVGMESTVLLPHRFWQLEGA
jgi:hypothetical protein